MGTVAAVVAVLGVAAAPATVVAADDPAAESETREVVDLDLRIAADGRAVGRISQLVELDTESSLALSTADHEHMVAITVRKADERGRTLTVTLDYQCDGKAVMDTVTIEAAAKKAKVVRSKDGHVALSLQMAPKTVSVDELPTPKPSRPPVEIVEDTNDPLAGI